MKGKKHQTRKLHDLRKQAHWISAYNKADGFDFVRRGLTPALTGEKQREVHKHLRIIHALSATLGTDSTWRERQGVYKQQKALMLKIKDIDFDYWESIQPND